MAVRLTAFPIADAGDASGLAAVLASWADRARLREFVIFAKVPGPATLNDSSRELAQKMFGEALQQAGVRDCRMILSVGCEGIGASGGWLLAEDGRVGAGPARLVMVSCETAIIPDAERGQPPHVLAVSEAVRDSMAWHGIRPADVRLVMVKSPVRRDQANATGRSRGAAALGVAVALGEVDEAAITPAAMDDPALGRLSQRRGHLTHDVERPSQRWRALAGQQLGQCEGLDQVVVGAGIESLDTVLDGVACRQHQDGGVVGGGPHPSAHVKPVDGGKADVEDDGVRWSDGQLLEGLREGGKI